MTGCATNPVTGKSELKLISAGREAAIGRKNYLPTQQSQGGLYRVDTALIEYVQQVGKRLAAVSSRQLPYEFVVINNSTPNAWALPGGKIAINRGLLMALDNEAELAAVLGHEIVHSAASHGAKQMQRSMLLNSVVLATALLAGNEKYSNYIVGGAWVGTRLIGRRYSRLAELEADKYGQEYMARAGYDPAANASLQEKFLALAGDRKTSWLEGLFATHPPSEERLQRNRETTTRLQQDIPSTARELGAERYRQKLAYLNARKDAYAAFDQAMTLANAGDTDAALSRVDKAISAEPREARFSGLKAHILREANRTDEAISFYNEALQLDPAYYEYHLGRGLTYLELGEPARAKSDLKASTRLLPTATAAYELGQLALQAGDRSTAKEYFRTVMSASGPLAEKGRAAFVRLDLVDNPEPYFSARSFIRDKRFSATITNRSGLDVQGLQVRFSARINGEQYHATAFTGALRANDQVTLDSGWWVKEGGRVEEVYVRVVGVTT